MKKQIFAALMAAAILATAAGCTTGPAPEPAPTEAPITDVAPVNPTKDDTYQNTAAYVNGATMAVDSLGRKLTSAEETTARREGKYIGIFYFMWIGEHGTNGPYDNSIISQVPGALKSEAAWKKAGGGDVGAHHFWGKPMFGYYRSSDEWVMRKHVQMLTEADIDFLFFDTTNAVTYDKSTLKLMAILDEYQKQGWKVPKVVFYTNSASGKTMNTLYTKIYKAHPEYSDLWFNWDGKPLIIGDKNDSETSKEVKEFFRIKASVWPNGKRTDDGFPWMEFGRNLTDNAVYGLNGRKEVVNVSLAQHDATCTMSLTAWYGANDRTRSWHDGANDTSENAYVYGYNFQEQFEWALGVDPEMITITGWNEWVAQRQPAREKQAIIFVDNADPNTSRDIEPMEGGYGDNYYMQMISLIRKYKGTDGYVPADLRVIDINGGFAQWNDVKAYYKDFVNDVVDRNYKGFGKDKYTDETGRNDFDEMKVAEDKDNLYFFVKTVENITAPEGDNWMNLYIGTGASAGWNGYNYVLNYKTATSSTMYLGKIADGDDTYSVSDVGEVSYRIKDNLMMVQIPKAMLGISNRASFTFQWTDNCVTGDVFSFYKNGDAAPIGRQGYYYTSAQ